MPISYELGDATEPSTGVLVHVVNDRGGWGKGFVKAISARWSAPERRFRAWAKGRESGAFELGQVQFVSISDHLFVANVLAQHGYRTKSNPVPLQYDALEQGLDAVALFARDRRLGVHMPRIGCGLAGGSWDRVEALIASSLDGIDVTVFDYGS